MISIKDLSKEKLCVLEQEELEKYHKHCRDLLDFYVRVAHTYPINKFRLKAGEISKIASKMDDLFLDIVQSSLLTVLKDEKKKNE